MSSDATALIATPADFWRHVQEPSTRVADKRLLARLSVLALDRYQDRHIRAAAAINLLYRSLEPEWVAAITEAELQRIAEQTQGALVPKASFSDCRWYLSSCLAQCAGCLARADRSAALEHLSRSVPVRDSAYGFGQVYTNFVKCTLLQLVIDSSAAPLCDFEGDLDGEDRGQAVAHILQRSNRIAQHYRFDNQWAYEELAYVYRMMREIHNWHRLSSAGLLVLDDLEAAGFAWRCVGAPFAGLIGRSAA